MAETALCHPTATEAGGSWVNLTNVETDDTNAATSYSSPEWTSTYKNAAETSSLLSLLPTDLTSIDGIEVIVRMYDVFGDQDTALDVDLSWDGDTNYTTAKQTAQPDHATPAQDYTLGGSTDTWGRSWSRSEFSDANFYLRMAANGSFVDELRVEFVEVKVYYTPAAAGSTPIHFRRHVGFSYG